VVLVIVQEVEIKTQQVVKEVEEEEQVQLVLMLVVVQHHKLVLEVMAQLLQ
jgi:hypothetical protein